MLRAAGLTLIAILTFGLAGCGVEVGGIELHQQSMLDRCSDFMQAAFPGGHIKVTKTAVVPDNTQRLSVVIASVQGDRHDLPKETTLRRDVAVECRFENGILTSFRWTKGPLH